MAKSKAKKTAEGNAKSIVIADIRTNGDHQSYIDWSLDLMPNPYFKTAETIRTETGYQVSIGIDHEGDKHFVCRYLAQIAMEIKTLDEGNVKIVEQPVTAEMEVEE
jgi:hypothetical protein